MGYQEDFPFSLEENPLKRGVSQWFLILIILERMVQFLHQKQKDCRKMSNSNFVQKLDGLVRGLLF